MEKLELGMSEEQRSSVIEQLQQYLADSQVLYAKTQGFHWNLVDPNFFEWHEAFQAQYEDINESIDETAERVRMLGGYPETSLAGYETKTQLKMCPNTETGHDMVRCLEGDHACLVRWLRGAIKVAQAADDEGTADYLIGRLRVHEKTAWMLRSTTSKK